MEMYCIIAVRIFIMIIILDVCLQKIKMWKWQKEGTQRKGRGRKLKGKQTYGAKTTQEFNLVEKKYVISFEKTLIVYWLIASYY